MTVFVTNPREGEVVLKYLMTNVNYDGVHSCRRGESKGGKEGGRGREREKHIVSVMY